MIISGYLQIIICIVLDKYLNISKILINLIKL